MLHPLPLLSALLGTLGLLLSPGSPADEPLRQPAGERSQQQSQVLQQALPDTQQQWLGDPSAPFLGLWLPSNLEQTHGVVIIVPGDGETADWPDSSGPLRRKLPDAGWASLSLSLPDPLDPQPSAKREAETVVEHTADDTEDAEDAAKESPATPPRPPAAEAGSEEPAAPVAAVAEDIYKRHAQHVQQRIEAAIAFARQQPSTAVALLGHGSGAYWVSRYLSEQPESGVGYLVLVDAQAPRAYADNLASLVASLKLPTGDFYYRDQSQAARQAQQRLNASRREQRPNYVQINMQMMSGNPAVEREYLYRRIRGWLNMEHP